MPTVLAALDNSLAANPVLVAARSLARVLGDRLEAIHVLGDGVGEAEGAARGAGVPLQLASGPVVERLVEAGEAADVAAMVIGARGTVASAHTLGSTAMAVVTSLRTPVVVVPPVAEIAPRLRSALVPLEETTSPLLTPRSTIELAPGDHVDVIVLYVGGGHYDEEWTREVLGRYCPWGIGEVRVERRAGRREEIVPMVAEELSPDLVVLGWARQLSDDRGPVVHAVLERSKLPVMLIPVSVRGGDDDRP
jgi:nucleotide-binding universal stress UspA family protein